MAGGTALSAGAVLGSLSGTVTSPITVGQTLATPSPFATARFTFNASGGSFTCTLPDATKSQCAELHLYKALSDTSNNPVYFNLSNGQLVDNISGASAIALVGAGHYFVLWSDGVTWRVGDMTRNLFSYSFSAGAAGDGKGSTFTGATTAPTGAPNSSNDYWWNSNGGAYYFAGGGATTPGTWTGIAASGVWQGAAVSSLALGGSSGAWTLTAVLNAVPQSVNAGLGAGGYFICGTSAGGTNWNRGPSNSPTGPIWAIASWNASTKTLTATSTFAGSLVAPPTTLGTIVLCTSSAGYPDVYPAPCDYGSGLLTATIAIPPKGLLDFHFDWHGNIQTFTAAGGSGWICFWDATNNLYLTNGLNSVASCASGPASVGNWTAAQVSNSSGVPNYNEIVWTPGTVINFQPRWKYINTYGSNSTGFVMFQDSSQQTFTVKVPNY